MNRRKALQAIGTVILGTTPGCTTQLHASGEQPPSTASQDPNTDDSSETTDALSKPITADDIAFDVTVLQQFTNDHPAQLEVSFTNDSETRVRLSGGPILPFTGLDGEHQDRDARLLLMPDGNDWITPTDSTGDILNVPLVPSSRTDGCWAVEYDGMLREQSMLVDELRPGEAVRHTYTLLDWTSESCLAVGNYTFSEEHSLQRGDSSAETDEFEATFGFEVELDAAQSVSVTVRDPTVRNHTH